MEPYELDEVSEQVVDEALGDFVEEDLVDDTMDMMDQAVQRIEEANLFRTLMKQSVFGPNSARPEILESVGKKIKQFAMQELKSLLGIEQSQYQGKIQLPFSETEMANLKVLASNLSETEINVLKILIAKVLKASPSAATQPEPKDADRTPSIVQINTSPGPTVVPKQNQPVSPATKKRRGPARTPSEKKEKSFNMPNQQTKRKPMPTAEQLAIAMGSPDPVVSFEGVNSQAVQKGRTAMGDIVKQLTGGQVMAIDASKPADSV